MAKATRGHANKTATVGFSLRERRTAKGLTLDKLAAASELTRGYISLVERGLKTPSLAALLRLAAALDVNVTDLFEASSAPTPRYTLTRQQSRSALPAKEGGYELVALAAGRTGKRMEPFLVRPPFENPPQALHAGEEVVFVVSGHVVIRLEGEDIALKSGDSIYFSGDLPHEVRSVGKKRAEILVVVVSVEPSRA
jgi:transcriptional regulator with XRE-family HTH domain